MSSGLQAQLQVLSKRADKLQTECVELAEAIAELLTPQAFGDWVLVDDGFPPLPIQEFTALKTLQRFRSLEDDGFPVVPEECVRVIARSLPCGPEEVVDRARKAYVTGFLARIALYQHFI
jgi:hydrogenase maturation factor